MADLPIREWGRSTEVAMATKNRDRKEVQQLIEMGKSKGFLTYDEVNDALPADMVAADQMDDVLGVLGDEDIEIVDAATQVKIAPKRIAEEQHAEQKTSRDRDQAPSTAKNEEDLDGYYSKSNDPVRMYLRKMGSVSLLTREGEVEIAKRIETGEHMVLSAILNSPVAVREIIDLGDKLRKHKIRVKDIIRDAEDDERRVRRGRGGPPHPAAHRQGEAPRQGGAGPQGVARDLRAVAQEGHRGRDRREPPEDGRDARGDAPQQEDDREDRRQAPRAHPEDRARRERASLELEKRTGVEVDQLRKEARQSRGGRRGPSASTSASTASRRTTCSAPTRRPRRT